MTGPSGLEIVQLPVGAYQANCYLVAREGGSGAVVIDPGDEPDAVQAELARRGWTAAGVLVTHGHIDHIGGVATVARAAGVDVWMPAGEADLLREHPAAPHAPKHLLEGGERVSLAGIEFAVTLVPGHSPASVAFGTDGHLFVGDVLFAGSVGRTDLAGGDMQTLLESIATLLRAYPPETIVLPGHGPVTTLGDERDTNPFLGPLRA
ncbi:MAG TPA: MBL fold metallo-hydrolase [Gaiellales bacterium]|nr:MBL fold metallo-hydrolase [Gaiellales bacterium]